MGFGVIGANSFVANAAVLPAVDAAHNARLVATASRGSDVPERWASTDVGDYDAVLDHPDVDAVYIPLPNGMHLEWTKRAAAAGKHVLCEKPLAADADTAQEMAAVCAEAGVLLAEAWMTPFDRRWAAAQDHARNGSVGAIDTQHHQFTFTIGPDAADNYRWDPNQGGGALLDVGIYTVGTAVALWGTDCTVASVDRVMSVSGVDATTAATLHWSGGRSASIRCSFVEPEMQRAKFLGADGLLSLQHAAFTSGHDFDDQILQTGLDPDDVPETIEVEPGDPYQGMVEAFADAVRGTAEWPRPVERSIELLRLLDQIRDTSA